jgi:TRIAD3 protein (E3 ubiquitin-protein ligase RNF216)
MHVTCRKCKKPDHLPKSCEEYAADAKTDKLHEVEEAMTEALLRRCPKCETPVLKEDGVSAIGL